MQKVISKIIILIILVVLLGLAITWKNSVKNTEPHPSAPPSAYEPYAATLAGMQTCLPHKNTSGPQTLECAIGMKTDAGDYYALDLNSLSTGSSTPFDIPGNRHFIATGTITPAERLDSDHWKIYNMKGIFSVTNLQLDAIEAW